MWVIDWDMYVLLWRNFNILYLLFFDIFSFNFLIQASQLLNN